MNDKELNALVARLCNGADYEDRTDAADAIAALRQKRDAAYAECHKLRQERDAARAEADALRALLVECRDGIDDMFGGTRWLLSSGLLSRINAALSREGK